MMILIMYESTQHGYLSGHRHRDETLCQEPGVGHATQFGACRSVSG